MNIRTMDISDYESVYALWLSCCFVAEKDGRRGYIYHMSVAGKYRRCGIGTELVNACLSALKNEGISKVVLLVFRYNEAGNAFWEKQGFILREDIFYRNKALCELVRIDT